MLQNVPDLKTRAKRWSLFGEQSYSRFYRAAEVVDTLFYHLVLLTGECIEPCINFYKKVPELGNLLIRNSQYDEIEDLTTLRVTSNQSNSLGNHRHRSSGYGEFTRTNLNQLKSSNYRQRTRSHRKTYRNGCFYLETSVNPRYRCRATHRVSCLNTGERRFITDEYLASCYFNVSYINPAESVVGRACLCERRGC